MKLVKNEVRKQIFMQARKQVYRRISKQIYNPIYWKVFMPVYNQVNEQVQLKIKSKTYEIFQQYENNIIIKMDNIS